MSDYRGKFLAAALVAVSAFAFSPANAQVAVSKSDNPLAARAGGAFRGAMALPRPSAATVQALLAATGSAPGGSAAGSQYSIDGKTLVGPRSSGISSQAYGTGNFPFTTERAQQWTNNGPNLGINDPVGEYPWRPTGKLWMHFSDGWYVCTASLIKPGVLVTAAHCVFNYGKKGAGWASQVYWYPANYGSAFPTSTSGAPYGVYRGRTWAILSPYYNGTDTCTVVGVVCNNDIALVVLWRNHRGKANNAEVNPGRRVGWYGYGWNGPGWTTSPDLGRTYVSQITQLGYPVAIDHGWKMIRTDSADRYYTSGNLKGQFWGSAQTGGSSGGPEIINFGTAPHYLPGASPGSRAAQWVVGVTSWGYTNINVKIQGASWFGQNIQFPGGNYGGYGAGNIGALVNYICSKAAYHPSCV